MNQAERNMRASLTERGYAVIACLSPKEIGETIPAINLGDEENEWTHPWGVTAQTDLVDYQAQCRLGGDIPWVNPAYKYFYRVVTD